MEMDTSSLIEMNRLAHEQGQRFTKKRFAYAEITAQDGRHFTGIVGPRGAGKTILLKQIAAERSDCFYISLDAFEGDLFETIRQLNRDFSIRCFLLDEVHFHRGFEGVLKKTYDFLQDVRIVFTGSVALALFNSAYDLSRRVVLKKMLPFSLREYVFLKYGIDCAPLSLTDIIEKNISPSIIDIYPYFSEYLRGGILPFALDEPNPLPILKNIVTTVVRKDLAYAGGLNPEETDQVIRMLEFIGKSGIDGINYTSLSQNIKITKYKAQQYVDLLEKAFILNRVLPAGTNVMKEPKILMAAPYRLLYRDYETALGGLREDFFVESMRMTDKELWYLKSTRGEKTPDYLTHLNDDQLVIEIGGKGKGRQQFKGVEVKRKLILSDSIEASDMKRPLYWAGLMT